MILVVDSSAFVLLVNPDANPPDDPETGQPTTLARERVQHFISSMGPNDTLIIPTPVLAEVLVGAEGGAPGILEQIGGMARLRVAPFDERAAIETAVMTRDAINAGSKRGDHAQSWNKVKFDRQIIAIARVVSASRIYADDKDLAAFARGLNMDVVSTWELPLPPTTEDLFTSSGLSPYGQTPDSTA